MAHSGTKVVVNGIEYSTLKEPYEIYKPKASYNTVRQRYMINGYTGDEAFELVPRNKKRKPREVSKDKKKVSYKNENGKYEIDGIEYDTISDAARAFGKEPTLVHNRLVGNKMSLEEACKKPIDKYHPIEVNGTIYNSPMEAFEAEGKVPVSTYQSRKRAELADGKTIEQCIYFCLGITNSPNEKP